MADEQKNNKSTCIPDEIPMCPYHNMVPLHDSPIYPEYKGLLESAERLEKKATITLIIGCLSIIPFMVLINLLFVVLTPSLNVIVSSVTGMTIGMILGPIVSFVAFGIPYIQMIRKAQVLRDKSYELIR